MDLPMDKATTTTTNENIQKRDEKHEKQQHRVEMYWCVYVCVLCTHISRFNVQNQNNFV